MRAIVRMDDQARARILGDYLYVQGIENQVDPDPAGGWSVFVHDDDRLEAARKELEAYEANPSDPRYAEAVPEARRRRGHEAREDAEFARQQVHVGQWWQTLKAGPLTTALIAVSIAVTLYAGMGENTEVADRLLIAPFFQPTPGVLPEVMHGEVWRLVTPIFLHLGILHILFNMFWLFDLGTMIERRQGALLLGVQVLVIAIASNLCQYFWAGPAGGMSGVVYGLFGYVWVHGWLNPASGFRISRQNITIMLVWLVLCMTGWLGPIGNAAHVSGLVIGAAWGIISAKWPVRSRG